MASDDYDKSQRTPRWVAALAAQQATQIARGPYGWMAFVPGGALILLGLVIWAMPQILIALIAGTFIGLGALLLLMAWRIRQRM